MIEIKDIFKIYKSAERDKIFPFSEWHRRDVFKRLIRPFLIAIGYNPDQINYDDTKGIIELKIRGDLKVIIYVSSIQEEQRFEVGKTRAKNDTIPMGIEPPEYEIALVTNFEKWFFYFDGKEIYAVAGERLEEEYDTIKLLISRDATESGGFKEVARKLLHKEDNEPLRQELNVLRVKIANKILQERTNTQYLKNPNGSYNNEILNEITTRWITRFLALKLAEDSAISFNFTLKDIIRSFELSGKAAKPVPGAKVKEETLSNAIRALMNEFERRFNGGIFMYEGGVDYITIPDAAFFDMLNFTTGWAFTLEDARIIGFVYERFLGQEIVVEERKGEPGAVLKSIGEARGRRRAGGVYYTPKYIVDYIVENTLGEILKEKREEIDNAVENLDIDKFTELLRQVKSLRVLDPACGSGSFLIKVLAEFKNFYEKAKDKAKEVGKKIDALKRERMKGQILFIEDKEVFDIESKYSELKKELDEINFPGAFALRHNIYGVDLDPKAIDITAFTLMVQVYDELKDGARCPTMIDENLKVGNALVSAIVPDERNRFVSRKELKKFKDDISNLIKFREAVKSIDILDDGGLRKLLEENFDDVVDVYLHIKEDYPNAIPTPQQNLLDEWHERAKNEPIEKTFDILINQTGLARIFLKEVYFRKIEKVEERIEGEINSPLIKYFNSEKRVLKDRELEQILADGERVKEELRFVKDRAVEISKSQPSKVFNWEIEFPEVFFNEDGTLKENPGFDCVVGNPPHGADLVKVMRDFTSSQFSKTSSSYKNTAGMFIELSTNICNSDALNGMIIPKSLTFVDGWRDTREFLISVGIREVGDISKAFEDVKLEQIIILWDKTSTNTYDASYFKKQEKILTRMYNIDTAKDLDCLVIYPSEIEMAIYVKIKYRCIFMKDVSRTFRGLGLQSKKIQRKTPFPILRGDDIERYNIKSPKYYVAEKYLLKNKSRSEFKDKVKELLSPKIVSQRIVAHVVKPIDRVIIMSAYDKVGILTFDTVENTIITNRMYDERYIMGCINSDFISWYAYLFIYNKAIRTMDFDSYYMGKIPIASVTPNQQAPIISLVDAIIQKKKEYHAIPQNIEDYVDFKAAQLIRLDEFLKIAVEDFEVLSSLRVSRDNFDALRVKTEDDEVILEYGTRREIEEYEEIDEEDESVEVRGNKYVIEWQEAGRGKIKDKEAIIFLEEILEKEKRISKAQTKNIWQKIAEVKIPEFSDEVKQGFLRYKSAMEKANILDEEILKIDRAIDRLVYHLYGLTEDEITVVEQSVWGDRFEEMYGKLPVKDIALKLSESYGGRRNV